MFLKHTGKALAFCSLFLIAGCSSRVGAGNLFPPAGNNPIKIDSVPAGADVYVMGEKIGMTPLQIDDKDVFPNIYPSSKQSLYGTITLKKEGCSDYTRTVSGEIISAGLRAKLDCGEFNPASPDTAGNMPRANETVEQRLEKIKDLQNKGLITDEEAKKARARVLNDL